MVISYLGGGYGSKSYTKFEPLVAALARKADAPVRVCNSVSDSMLTVRRHAAKVRIKTGFKQDGTIMAREAEIYLDTGAYDDNGPQVTIRAATRVLGPYRIPNILTNAYSVYTNSGSAGSFRAIGAPQVIFAGESQIDVGAARLGMDPAEIRLKNLLRKGEELRPGLKGIDANLASALKKLINASQWRRPTKKELKPVGLACAVTNAGATPVSIAMARLQSDGVVNILAGSTEMGQGVRTVLAQIAGEELTVPLDQISIPGADTKVTPYDSSTGSSRSTTCMGHAVQAAARDLKKQLIKIAAEAFRVSQRQVTLQDGALICGEARLSFKEALERRFGKGSGGELIGRGETGPDITDNQLPVFWEVGMGMVELDVDEETGQVRIKRLISVADVGKAIHPDGCIGQEEGAAMMGIGHTFFRADALRCERAAAQSESCRLSIADLRRCARGISYGACGEPRWTGSLWSPRHGRGRTSVRGAFGDERLCAGHRYPYKGPTPDSRAGVAGIEATESEIFNLIDTLRLKGKGR